MSVEKLIRKELLGPRRGSSTRASVSAAEGMISLAAGDPNFLLPKYIAETLKKAVQEGCTHYCFGGDPELKVAVSEYYKKYGYEADPNTQVIITAGGSQSIFQSYASILNSGDEVIALDPAYGGGTRSPGYFGAKTVFAPLKVEEDLSFSLDPEEVKKVITGKTKGLYIDNPGNPSGLVYSKKELKAIADLAIDHDFAVLVDETYTEYIWSDKKHVPLITMPGMENRTLVAMALTKMFAWAGMRTGWVIAGPELAPYVAMAPGSGASWPIQRAAIVALTQGEEFVKGMVREYEERLDYGVKRLNEMPEVRCVKPEGAFYLFPDISGTGLSSNEFTSKLFEEENVRIVSGAGYGPKVGEGRVRLSMIRPLSTQKMPSWFKATTDTTFEAAMDRMERFTKRLAK
jgi:aspartate/methionine/tyrosine aminotransferase